VRAVKKYGSIAPIRSPANCVGSRISTDSLSILVMKAPKRARPTRQADPIANPLPTAAVVFPAASRASVKSLIYSGSPHI